MQYLGMLIFFAAWLFVLWLGSIALEATGMERHRARFQALSALSGTGFTTAHAETVVEHPRRRQIIAYLMFLGNAGIAGFLILLVLYLRVGLREPNTIFIVITVAALLAIGLCVWLGPIDKLTNVILRLIHRSRAGGRLGIRQVLRQSGGHAVVRLAVGHQSRIADLCLKDSGFKERDIVVLAIERGGKTMSYPAPEEKLLAGDELLCYGRIVAIKDMTQLKSD